jgi:HK97 family phage prohead protease
MMEYKVLLAQPKAIEGRSVTGLAAVTGNVDGGGDRIIKNAFKKTIRENGKRVKHLWMHDPWQPPTAVVKELVEVGVDDLPDSLKSEHPEATGGLQVVREYLDTPRGNEILTGIKSGAISEMSFGYDPVKFDFEEIKDGDAKGMMVRNLREIRLWDVSDVTWGMNELTVAAKRALAPFLPAYHDRMPDEQYGLLETLVTTVQSALDADALKAGRVLSARNLERLKTALDTLSEILLAAEPEEDDDEKRLLALTEQLKRRTIAAQFDNYLFGG